MPTPPLRGEGSRCTQHWEARVCGCASVRVCGGGKRGAGGAHEQRADLVGGEAGGVMHTVLPLSRGLRREEHTRQRRAAVRYGYARVGVQPQLGAQPGQAPRGAGRAVCEIRRQPLLVQCSLFVFFCFVRFYCWPGMCKLKSSLFSLFTKIRPPRGKPGLNQGGALAVFCAFSDFSFAHRR